MEDLADECFPADFFGDVAIGMFVEGGRWGGLEDFGEGGGDFFGGDGGAVLLEEAGVCFADGFGGADEGAGCVEEEGGEHGVWSVRRTTHDD